MFVSSLPKVDCFGSVPWWRKIVSNVTTSFKFFEFTTWFSLCVSVELLFCSSKESSEINSSLQKKSEIEKHVQKIN